MNVETLERRLDEVTKIKRNQFVQLQKREREVFKLRSALTIILETVELENNYKLSQRIKELVYDAKAG